MYRHSVSTGISVLFAVLLAGGMLLVLNLTAAAAPSQPAQIGNPLPNNCSGISEPGEEPPVCCAFGYVYYNGVVVAGAQVVIQSAGGVFTTTTDTGAASIDPYYANDLSDAPLGVSPGDTITLTAMYSGATASTVYQVAAGGQQVDVVIPAAEGDQPPIGTINYIHPNPAGQRSDMVTFAGSGMDGDVGGIGIVAWEWSSDLDGDLSTQENFQMEASGLSAGTHTISFQVQDNEGDWSAPVGRTLMVEPEFDIQQGWQVIVSPALPDPAYDAKTLLEEIADQGGCPEEISRWLPDLGNWSGYLPGLPFGNFGVDLRQPYFLRASCRSALRLPAAFSIAPPEVITLTTGWNFIAPPPTAGVLTAASACDQIAAQGGAVSEIDRWDAGVGNWAGHICGLPFGDFEMVPDEGYFVKSQADSVWHPASITANHSGHNEQRTVRSSSR